MPQPMEHGFHLKRLYPHLALLDYLCVSLGGATLESFQTSPAVR